MLFEHYVFTPSKLLVATKCENKCLFQVSGDTTAEAPGQARRLVNMIRSCGEEYILMSFIGFL